MRHHVTGCRIFFHKNLLPSPRRDSWGRKTVSCATITILGNPIMPAPSHTHPGISCFQVQHSFRIRPKHLNNTMATPLPSKPKKQLCTFTFKIFTFLHYV
ncbi:hypothetical protein CDAR_165381 [Caerostris darwini]|uniref:Uncharacterized protein n=1 Tax=Caerostris darwini TaxID=1538125 RepID=A0AAV4NXY1_9ARAC|nr:hypothetical protein CDAR_165381 [Caerostris darwini]